MIPGDDAWDQTSRNPLWRKFSPHLLEIEAWRGRPAEPRADSERYVPVYLQDEGGREVSLKFEYPWAETDHLDHLVAVLDRANEPTCERTIDVPGVTSGSIMLCVSRRTSTRART